MKQFDIDNPNITKKERAVLKSLVEAWNLFIDLGEEEVSPDQRHEFCHAIHACQAIVGWTIMRRLAGEGPVSYSE